MLKPLSIERIQISRKIPKTLRKMCLHVFVQEGYRSQDIIKLWKVSDPFVIEMSNKLVSIGSDLLSVETKCSVALANRFEQSFVEFLRFRGNFSPVVLAFLVREQLAPL
jgi:hypothetical protein